MSTASAPPRADAFRMVNVTAGYGETTVLRDIDLRVAKGSVVAIIGANGAGKTTLLRTASGIILPRAGRILVNDVDTTRMPPQRRLRSGLALVPEGRSVFRSMSVLDNLRLFVPAWRRGSADIDQVLTLFPRLGQRAHQPAGQLSGGEQQMLALSRAFLSGASVVLLDELSMGLAPVVIDRIFEAIVELQRLGISLVIVEQYVNRILEIADYVYLMERGAVAFGGTPAELSKEELFHSYLGAARADGDQADPPKGDPR